MDPRLRHDRCPFKLPQSAISDLTLVGIEAWDRSATGAVSCSLNVTNFNGDVLTGPQGATISTDQVAPKQFFINPPSGVAAPTANMSITCAIPGLDGTSRSACSRTT